jgi:hypothetical protein
MRNSNHIGTVPILTTGRKKGFNSDFENRHTAICYTLSRNTTKKTNGNVKRKMSLFMLFVQKSRQEN